MVWPWRAQKDTPRNYRKAQHRDQCGPCWGSLRRALLSWVRSRSQCPWPSSKNLLRMKPRDGAMWSGWQRLRRSEPRGQLWVLKRLADRLTCAAGLRRNRTMRRRAVDLQLPRFAGPRLPPVIMFPGGYFGLRRRPRFGPTDYPIRQLGQTANTRAGYRDQCVPRGCSGRGKTLRGGGLSR
jgi:hypothetical protein